MQQYYFHASPVSNREGILAEGLTGHLGRKMWQVRCTRRGQPTGNYCYSDLGGARGYAKHLHNSQHRHRDEFGGMNLDIIDIWQVDVQGLEVEPDPENVHKYGALTLKAAQEEARWCAQVAPRWRIGEWIPPNRLELVETLDWAANPQLSVNDWGIRMPQSLTRVPGYRWGG